MKPSDAFVMQAERKERINDGFFWASNLLTSKFHTESGGSDGTRTRNLCRDRAAL